MSKARLVAGAIGLIVAAAATFMAPWEGTKYVPYQDVVGVWTVCRGVTGAQVIPGRRYTEGECQALERPRINEAYSHVQNCIAGPLTNNQRIALTSLVFNTGRVSVCGSTIQRKANAGQPFCAEFDKWVYAGGKKWTGLIRRRAAERQLCETPDGR